MYEVTFREMRLVMGISFHHWAILVYLRWRFKFEVYFSVKRNSWVMCEIRVFVMYWEIHEAISKAKMWNAYMIVKLE